MQLIVSKTSTQTNDVLRQITIRQKLVAKLVSGEQLYVP